MNTKRYNAVLDVFALVALYPLEAQTLRNYTLQTALEFLKRKANTADVVVLLRLGKDLGYIEEALYAAYLRGLA